MAKKWRFVVLHTRAGTGGTGPPVSMDLREDTMGYTFVDSTAPQEVVNLQGVRAGLSGDCRVTDLSSAGAHRRLLLSRPPPRRTVRTLLKKQNWGVRHRGLQPVPPQP